VRLLREERLAGLDEAVEHDSSLSRGLIREF
jgi:hypothetical protein